MTDLNTQDQDLTILGEPVRRKRAFRLKKNPHLLKEFFSERNISQTKLAQACKTDQPYISKCLSNKDLMPLDLEARLFELRDKILKWESKNGKKFGD